MAVEINDLPDEVLEFILSYLPPYKDLEECQFVCKRWNSVVKNVMRRSKLNLYKGLSDFRLCWKTNTPASMNGGVTPIIAGRFSHSAVIHENSMYIFGGGSSTDTTFNDLWRFDLSKRQWIRPLSMGSYPSPKGSATMLCYNNKLILFGGWRYPSLHPPYQPWCLFDELHLYDIKENRWIIQTSIIGNGPPPMAGHSATIHRNKMIVFGGYQIDNEVNSNSNDVWCLNLDTFIWRKPEISNIKPPPRYGQFQIALNDTSLLIVGGCGGPNNMFSDAWLLNMSTDIWQWINIPIKNKKWAATHMWCNPACCVGTKLVVLGPTPNLPSDFQIIKQQRSTSMMMNRLNHHLNHLPNPIDVGNNLLRINNQNVIRLDDNIPNYPRNYGANNNNNYNLNINNDNLNNNDGVHGSNQHQQLNNVRNHQDNSIRVAANQQQQQQNQNNLIEDEAANRLQRNLALRCREDDAKLPKRFDEPFEDRFRMAAFNVHQPKSRNSSRERQLERVRRMEEKMNALRNSRRNSNNAIENHSNSNSGGNNGASNSVSSGANAAAGSSSGAGASSNSSSINKNNANKKQQEEPSPKRTKRNCLAMFVCDISNVLAAEPYLEWIEYKNYGIISGAPERLILSSIVAGNGELIMFGGVHKESLSEMTHQVSNSVHFLTAPKQII